LLEIKAPEVILRNEKRMLQEAIDSLFDNSRKSNAVKAEGGRALKSLSDVLKGKQGRFRQNLLGKRVDYSGRSVIVVGPELKLHECGLPKDMAAELFKPFIIRKLIERGIVKTVKSARKLVDKKEAIVWDILENILRGHPVMLNRAPTLHRLSIQAFQPKLVEGKAIQLHPLVCSAFNADFDGDQMAVHVPLSHAAILEAQLLMLSSHNILNPQNGTPITLPSQDMVLGLYYITKGKKTNDKETVRGEGMKFYSPDEVLIAHNEGRVDLHAWIKVRTEVREGNELVKKLIETTVGRVIFNQTVPKEVGFVNALLTKKSLREIIGDIIDITNVPKTAKFLDDIKQLGFRTAFQGGLSFNVNDLIIPDMKEELLDNAKGEVDEVWDNYNMGLITNNERYNQIVDIWSRVDTRITETLIRELSSDKQGFNSVYMMLDSGARGSKQQIKQLAGIRGLMAKPRKSGSTGSEIIENPILSNFKGGLNVLDYFISTHGARKGLADTALKTADAGYLTRRLVDVAQDVVITEEDCGTLRGIATSALKDNEDIVEPLLDRIVGRTSLHNVFHPQSEQLLIAAGEQITEQVAKAIEDAGVEIVEIRSVLTCESKRGVCVRCYGKNLATGYTTQRGDAVGIIAAQSIGEPGTQLTLRTFHVGGAAGSASVESTLTARFEGTIQFDGLRSVTTENSEGKKAQVIIGRTGEVRIIDVKNDRLLITNNVPYGATLFVKDGQKVNKGDVICSWDPYNNVIVAEIAGTLKFENVIEGVTYREEADEQTGHREKVVIETKDKTKIPGIIIEGGKDVKSYNIPVGSHIVMDDAEDVKAGQVLVKIPRILGKLRDITGGLPRVTELFEARNPANPAIVSEIDGVITFGAIKRGNREIVIEARDGVVRKYLVPLTRQILAQDGDFVKAGTSLSDGQTAPGDILSIKGPFAVQEYVVNEIQEVYRLQGVKINDKHIEVIVRQMMKKVEIVDPGDTKFLEEDTVDKFEFIEENDYIFDKKVVSDAGDSIRLKAGQIVTLRDVRDENSQLRRADKKLVEFRDAKPATSQPLLLGITKASLGTQSWISAASFQETTKVLSSAAIHGKTDDMLGLKENVITGHPIPAGTGLREFENMIVGSKEEYELLQTTREAMAFDEEE
jgi:DNA-directed RNA polymerase subunit beta'